ncbi:uncharacterized protein UV8b_02228 [Ustilaginoidea virens]|uniref:Uncharacterized protein n=1 Tax=Ustilaginoidea virens TaxID=1159556 RepID=A0A8E5MFN2_USTVR|nr:uncharacterized protein UV8b_02228 [Ustilaginoidea virens]QUC17987.1 hypothetical protein UV8b_02228 [Ustilaginoidea virens]
MRRPSAVFSGTRFLAFFVALFALAGHVCGSDGSDAIFRLDKRVIMGWKQQCVNPPRARRPEFVPHELLGPRPQWRFEYWEQINGIIEFASDLTGRYFTDNSREYRIEQEILENGNVRHTYTYLGSDTTQNHVLTPDVRLLPADGTPRPGRIILRGHQPVTLTWQKPHIYTLWLKFRVRSPEPATP